MQKIAQSGHTACITLTHIYSLLRHYFNHLLFPSSHFRLQQILHNFRSHSMYLVLSRYFFCIMFTYVLYSFRECSLILYKCYRFEIHLSVIWKTSFIVLPLFTKQVIYCNRFMPMIHFLNQGNCVCLICMIENVIVWKIFIIVYF